ncbi:putative GTP-binding protein EngB [bacterium BMS3Abin03]|nr:putative GTP-binding protein EngB [bacterium BMS3Abin03]
MFENIKFIRSVFHLKDIPKPSLPVVILCGRSNVGKSSFINSLFNKKNLAKTSSSPGKTRSINYYNVDDKFYLVDLPGYGYAKTSKKEQEYWGKLLSAYIVKVNDIVLAVHLVDSRHAPSELDISLNELLRYADLPYIVLLSKSDKLNQSEKSKVIKNTKQFFPELIQDENLFLYSSEKGTGRKEILSRFSKLFYLS